MYQWFPCASVLCVVLYYDVFVNMQFQALAITCMALHYHSQQWNSSFHELMIISAAFGGYIVVLVGILTGIFTGQPVNKRIVRTFIVCLFCAQKSYWNCWALAAVRQSYMYFMYPEDAGDHFQALL